MTTPMAHTCTALLIHCIDFRFTADIQKFMADEHLTGDCDVVALAGVAKNLVDPMSESFREVLLKQIELSKKLHGISKVYVMNHMDCGAYGGHAAFGSIEDERARHWADMDAAGEVIQQAHPDIEVVPILAHISDEGAVIFEKR